MINTDKFARILGAGKKALKALFLISGMGLASSSILKAEFRKSEQIDGHAILYSESKTEVAYNGKLIVLDQTYTFEGLPKFLQGTAYFESQQTWFTDIKPLTEGLIYVVTPIKNEIGSQEDSLLLNGFSKVNHPEFKLFKGQDTMFCTYQKKMTYSNFRLDYYRFLQIAIPFFSPRELPSLSEPAEILTTFGNEHLPDSRLWQGCPSIEMTENRLWGAWFSGGVREPDAGNYGIISFSDDHINWKDPALVIRHPNPEVRVMDPQLWKDPQGRLWVFWVQNTGEKGFDGVWGTWAVVVEHPDVRPYTHSNPKRLCNGLMRNKPIVLGTGEWLLPAYNWVKSQSTYYMSVDNGESWKFQGGPISISEPSKNFFEHMALELADGTLWSVQRNIQESFSYDKGKTWTDLEEIKNIQSANSRVYLGRLKSGNLLMVYNNDPKKRKNLTVAISRNEGLSWEYQLMIDQRDQVSYPDVIQDQSGSIYIIYDYSRRGEKEILLSKISEEDIVNNKITSNSSYLSKVISKPKM